MNNRGFFEDAWIVRVRLDDFMHKKAVKRILTPLGCIMFLFNSFFKGKHC